MQALHYIYSFILLYKYCITYTILFSIKTASCHCCTVLPYGLKQSNAVSPVALFIQLNRLHMANIYTISIT